MEDKTTKKEFDKILSRLQKMQRECFKAGSVTCLEVRPFCSDGDYTIYVTAWNENVVRRSSDGEVLHFDSFYIYSFRSYEQNEEEVQRIVDFLSID